MQQRSRSGRRIRTLVALALVGPAAVASGWGAVLPTASAAGPTRLNASASESRSCFAARVGGTGVDGFAVRATTTGVVRVRLDPVDSASVAADWDVAVFDATDGTLLGASAAPRSYEVADGRVTKGQRLWVQGCRYAGRASSVKVSVVFAAAPAAGSSETTQLVQVATPTPAARRRLAALDLDQGEGTTDRSSDVVLHGRSDADADALVRAGLGYRVEVADLAAAAVRDRQADAAYAARTPRSDLPSGRTSYRHLWDYQ